MRNILACLLLLLATGCCGERVEDATAWMEISPEEQCPPPEEAKAELIYSGDELLSVDGNGVKKVHDPARQECCYAGSFVVNDASQQTEACRIRNGEGDVTACPTLADAARGDGFWWYFADGTSAPKEKVQVESLSGGPFLGDVFPADYLCVYPITQRRTADVCG